MSAAPGLIAYFDRVGYRGPVAPTLATLRTLHAAHAAAIPFENLAAFLGEPVALDLASLESKLLAPGRGGWCFEHNLLFAHVLEAMGYRVARLAARVRWNVPPGVVTPRSHMLLLVEAEGRRYIADVGFGGLTLTAPLRLEAEVVQQTPHEPHRLVAAGAAFTLQAQLAGEWQDLYTFDLQEQLPADYEAANWYLATHPRSQFVSGIIAARAAPGERHALRNTRYTVHLPGGEMRRRFIRDVDEFRAVLAERFHVRIPGGGEIDRRIAAMIDANPPA